MSDTDDHHLKLIHDDTGGQGDVSNVRRIRRVRTSHDPGAAADAGVGGDH